MENEMLKLLLDKFDQLERKIDVSSAKIDQINVRLDAHEEKLDKQEKKIDSHIDLSQRHFQEFMRFKEGYKVDTKEVINEINGLKKKMFEQ